MTTTIVLSKDDIVIAPIGINLSITNTGVIIILEKDAVQELINDLHSLIGKGVIKLEEK